MNRITAIAVAVCSLATPAFAQDAGTDVTITSSVVQPKPVEPTDDFIAKLKVPAGFKIAKFADGLMNARVLVVNPKDGTVYLSRREQGDLLMLKDTDGDGKADVKQVVAERPKLHGPAIVGDKLYFVSVNDVYVSTIKADGTLTDIQHIINDLPDGGQHQNRTMAVGPDGKLYISVGSTTNVAEESRPESATMLQASPDGKSRTIFASGLRNTIGFDWHPTTGALWGFDHGIDWHGDDEHPEELNKLEQGKRYGWPFVYGQNKLVPERQPSDGTSQETWAKLSTPPVLTYTSHSAPLAFQFYKANAFPAEFKNDAFATMRGSWNRRPPSGYEIVRIKFNDAGEAESIEPFITGWLEKSGEGWQHYGRLCGLAVAKDGSLLVSDDKNGIVYRITHEASAQTTSR